MPTTVSPSYPGRVLQNGSSGTEVARMQTYLNNLRVKYPAIIKLTVDGKYGSNTAKAVSTYQAIKGLTVDGKIGPNTWNTLVAENNAMTGDSADTYPGISMQNGSNSQDVGHMQSYLNNLALTYTAINKETVDNNYGSNNTAATQRFQKQHGLPGDGVIGKDTWNKIVSVYYTHIAVTTKYPGYPISQGASGDSVRFIQSYVSAAGFPTTIDGNFGPKTKNSVVAFQAIEGLKPDGVVGSITWAALVDAFNATI